MGDILLQFIFGKPASGKTYTILQEIKKAGEQGEKCVLIVPEQFSFESERAVLKTLGDKSALTTEVLSFSRIYDEVGRNVGGIAGKILSECDKIIFMKRALETVKTDLALWNKFTDSVSFAKTMLDSVGEMKINAVSPEDLRNIAEVIDKPTLRLKLCDTALIYETYDTLIAEKFIDPADTLTKLYNTLGDYRYFENKTVFLDSFKGFTGQQYKLIERIISQAKDVYISLTNDLENTSEYNVYTNIRKSVENIAAIARKYAVEIRKPVILSEPRFENDDLSLLEKIISGNNVSEIEKCENITVCKASSPADEAEFAARCIKKLVRENGYRYKDFVIIARESEKYGEAIISAAQKNKINLFYDSKLPLSSFPLAVAGESAINTLNFSTENILRFHKTGLGTLDYEEISVLENYTLLWNINGDIWLNEWDMNTKGLTSDNEENPEEIEKINILRKKAIEPLVSFKENFKGNAAQMVKALYELFESCNAFESLRILSEKFGSLNDGFSSDFLRQSFEEYLKIFDSIVMCFGNKTLKTSEFAETLNLAVSLAEVGVIPQTLDEVTFGTADRIRTLRPKVAFVLGANQGVFPKQVQNNGIFNITERKLLIENGINVSDNSVFTSIEEEFLVYSTLCSASEKLYISYYEQTLSGEKAEPSTFVEIIKSKFEPDLVCEPQKTLCENNSPETEDSAFSEFCRRLRGDISAAVTIKTALENSNSAEKIEFLEQSAKKVPKTISPDTAKKLFGSNIRMSASKFDNFNRCRFSFFCRYGLGAKKLQPADFDVMQRGTIVHFVLERLITDFKDGLIDFKNSDFDLLTEQYISEYLNSIKGFNSVKNAHTEFLISRISRSLKTVVQHIAEEISQSDFKPVACELKIGENGSFSFPYDDGKILINGSIDRVDKYNGYIRIIDYKTGSKSFKLPDILFGLNLQMLIYLYAVTRAQGLEDTAAAGILYQPSRRNTTDNDMSMNGLLQSDTELYSAMDKCADGKFVPKLALNKDGSISKRSTSYIEKEDFTAIFDYIEKLMRKAGNTIAKGDIGISPLDGRESPACKYCDFASVCSVENSEIPRVPDLKNEEVFEFMKEAEINGI